MASLSSGDRLEKATNGKISGQHEGVVPTGDEQTLADNERTLADSEQTLADADQSSAERDQASADMDQVASDRDQAASDRDLEHGADAGLHEVTRGMRERGARQRERTATGRSQAASARDASAQARDLAAIARDQAAAARDLAMAQLEAEDAAPRLGTEGEPVLRVAQQRWRAAQARVQAAEYRTLAAEDRQAAARDREQGARDRLQARADREALAQALKVTETDSLTGARSRAAGLADLDREVERSRRTNCPLTVIYVDVVGLKRRNDTQGHEAGDEMLKRTVLQIAERLRSYDLIIRLGGDEFLCSMSSTRLPEARERFSVIANAMADSHHGDAIRTGYAELTAEETAAELVARADRQLIKAARD
jgi:diguanylate cyclase (GGDEF)-like protein